LDYVKLFAEGCRANGVGHFTLLSSSGASKGSFFLYPQTKGQAEEAVKLQGFPRTSIYRPGLLDRGLQNRFIEKFAKAMFVPAMAVAELARAMRAHTEESALSPVPSAPVVEVFSNREIHSLAGRK
jgi:oxidoreductase